jgi:hypothetical protein
MPQIFYPGDEVMLFYGIADRSNSGIYQIIRSLPASADDERQYQVRAPEGYDRVVGERQIRSRLPPRAHGPLSIERSETKEITPSGSEHRPASVVSLAGLYRQRSPQSHDMLG